MKVSSVLFALLACACLSHAIDIGFYYGEGCPHCASTSQIFASLTDKYNLTITPHEVYYDAAERAAFLHEYERFDMNINEGGVPTTIVDRDTMIIGSMTESQWRGLFEACEEGRCPKGSFSHYTLVIPEDNETQNVTTPPQEGQVPLIDPLEEKNGAAALTLSVLMGAAIVDSVNPCTIAVMVLLLGAIMHSRGKKEALISGLVFSGAIFVMYMLYGLGIMKTITTFGISTIFYAVVTIAALILAIMELNAYFNYKPGFFAVEMPVFIRPYAKKVTQRAISPLGVAFAAVLCSIFLLPCSSGPYLVVLGMLAKSATLQTVGYLVLYNFLFVLPMVIITAVIHLKKVTIEQIGEAKDRYIRKIHLVSGIILLGLFLLMVLQLAGWL